MSASTALIIDDEPDIRELISMAISRMGIDCHVAANLEEARNLLGHYQFDICLTDMKLPDGNGVEFVRYILSVQPDLPVAVITAHGNMDAAVEAMKNGAYDFVSKPVDIALLRKLVSTAVASHSRSSIGSELVTPSGAHSTSGDLSQILIGKSTVMQELRAMILKVARSNAPVWITGESGTGKEMIARLIHNSSARSDKPFIPINCGAIPANLVESELFGHKKGSFTGAVSDNPGLFRKAEGGTLFLDEVAELPLPTQVKLLRAIQEKSIRAVGDDKEHSVDVRILSASHKDLAVEAAEGHFRHDLYYRLNVIQLRSPSLADRPEDIPELATHLLERIRIANNLDSLALTDGAIQKLSACKFPGNVRELENTLERSVALAEGSELLSDDILLPETPTTLLPGDTSALGLGSVAANTPADMNGNSATDDEPGRIRAALEQTRWNRKAAATLLGMTYRQLRYRIKQYGLDDTES